MSMAEKEITNKTKSEIAASEDNNISPREPKIFESGYFYLSQQINDLRDRMDAKFDKIDEKFSKIDEKFDKVDAKFDSMRKETDARFDKIDARFEKINEKLDKFSDKIDSSRKWAIGSVIAVLVGTISVIVNLVLK